MEYKLILLFLFIFFSSCKEIVRYEITHISFNYEEVYELTDGKYLVYDSLENGERNKRIEFEKIGGNILNISYFTPKVEKFLTYDIIDSTYSELKFYYKNGNIKAKCQIKDKYLLVKNFWDINEKRTVSNFNGYINEEIKWEYIYQSLKPSKERWSYNIADGIIIGEIDLKYYEYNTDSLTQEFKLYVEERKKINKGLLDISWNITQNFANSIKSVEK